MDPRDHKPMLRRTGSYTWLRCTCGKELAQLRPEDGMVPVIDLMYRHREKLRERERLTRCAP